MEKKYKIDIFDNTGLFLNSITSKIGGDGIIQNNIIFNNSIGFGNGDLNLELKISFNSNIVKNGNYIQVWEHYGKDDEKIIYSGFISKIDFLLEEGKKYTILNCIGLAGILNERIVLTSTSNGIIPSNYVKDLINSINSNYNIFSEGIIEDYLDLVNIELKGDTYLKAIQKIAALIGYIVYINPDGSVDFKSPYENDNIFLTMGLNVKNSIISKSIEKPVCNFLVLEFNDELSGTTIQKLYNDNASILEIGIRTDYIKLGDEINDEATADLFAENYLFNNKDEKTTFKIETNNNINFNVNNVIGRDLILMGVEKDFELGKIKEYTYTNNGLILKGEKLNNVSEELTRQIQKNLFSQK